jgi:outer membrane protein assembly factor BamD (BamD/ComL family)
MRGFLAAWVVVGSVQLAAAEPAKKVAPKKPVVMMTAKASAKADWSATPAKLEPGTPKLLQTQGMTAYKAGNYSAAVKKFSAAMQATDRTPSPELIYQAAQAYRLKCECAKALELYTQYLDVAPNGSAAPVCRWYVERLSDTP